MGGIGGGGGFADWVYGGGCGRCAESGEAVVGDSVSWSGEGGEGLRRSTRRVGTSAEADRTAFANACPSASRIWACCVSMNDLRRSSGGVGVPRCRLVAFASGDFLGSGAPKLGEKPVCVRRNPGLNCGSLPGGSANGSCELPLELKGRTGGMAGLG